MIILLGFANRFHLRRPLLEFDLFPGRHGKSFELIFILIFCGLSRVVRAGLFFGFLLFRFDTNHVPFFQPFLEFVLHIIDIDLKFIDEDIWTMHFF